MWSKRLNFRSLMIICSFLLIGFFEVAISTDGDLNFEVRRTHPGSIFTVQCYDLDNDGYDDIIFAGDKDTRLRVMFGSSGGNFEEPLLVGGEAATLCVGFLNDDDLPDIVANFADHLYLLINNGDRTFQVDSISQPYNNLGGVALGYIDDDTYLDIIECQSFDHTLIHFGDGSGGILRTINLPYDFMTVYVSDLNNDGIDDLVGLDDYGNGGIYTNDGAGNFMQGDTFSLNEYTMAASITEPIADFNNDGNADFAFITPQLHAKGNFFQSRIAVGYGDGQGGLDSISYLWINGTSYALDITDVNRDNYLDLAVLNGSTYQLELFIGSEQGNFYDTLKLAFQSEPTVFAVAVGDLDRDGNPDFVAGSNSGDSIKLFINQCPDPPLLSQKMTTIGFDNVNLNVANPANYRISRNYRTVAGAAFQRLDVNGNRAIDEQAVDCNLQNGEYKLVFRPKPNVQAGAKFSGVVHIGNKEATLFLDYDVPATSDSLLFYYDVEPVSSIKPASGIPVRADRVVFDWSRALQNPEGKTFEFQLDRYYDFRSPIHDLGGLMVPNFSPSTALGTDSVFYWRYRTWDGSSWSDFSHTFAAYVVGNICGDLDNTGSMTILDVAFLIRYLYKSGPPPNPPALADINGDGSVDILDCTYLINYIYKGGSAPICR
ncbi:hypothetical protein TRIP_C10042 [Candidatus Zixiibacteriota bacterium]|nr:hypothetical protein TRIP_C10042 [candidate division Zixibacteria bacterium]